MGDERLIRMNKPLKKEEKVILMRSLLRDGLTQTQAEAYVKAVESEVKSNHEKHKSILNNKKKEKKRIRPFEKLFKRK